MLAPVPGCWSPLSAGAACCHGSMLAAGVCVAWWRLWVDACSRLHGVGLERQKHRMPHTRSVSRHTGHLARTRVRPRRATVTVTTQHRHPTPPNLEHHHTPHTTHPADHRTRDQMGTKVANSLAAELAFKANVDAVARDYVTEPHLGAAGARGRPESPWITRPPDHSLLGGGLFRARDRMLAPTTLLPPAACCRVPHDCRRQWAAGGG
jgi:hypothetical protein